MTTTTPSGTRLRLRILRPLAWWIILVLVLYGYRLHQRLIAQTRLAFEVTIEGRSVSVYELTSTLDGRPVWSGQFAPIGWHTFSVSHPKADAFSKEIFIWYGENNLGDVSLHRSRGTLMVTANPPAQTIAIRGPEFSQTFTNVSSINPSVPTDRYVIEAQYRYLRNEDQTTVSANAAAAVRFAPRLGTVQLERNQTNASFQLMDKLRRVLESGNFPAFLPDLPAGNYTLLARHRDNEQERDLTIDFAKTNRLSMEFLYGTGFIETKSPGATVWSGNRQYGVTPLVLDDLPIGNREFTLRRDDYEPLIVSLNIGANQTNSVQKSLVNRHYRDAIQQARLFLAQRDYDVAKQSAMEALKYQPDDSEAAFIERQARGLKRLSEAEALGSRGNFAQAIEEANAAVSIMPDYEPAKVLVADLIRSQRKKEAEEKRLAAEKTEYERKQREAELAAKERQDRLKRVIDIFNAVNRAYGNAPMFAAHELMVSNAVGQVRLLTERELTPPGKHQSFRWKVKIASGPKLGVVPDRVFALEFSDKVGNPQRLLFFLEADRGTMPVQRRNFSQTSFYRKLLAYEATWSQSIHRTRFGFHRFRVLTVTTGVARVKSLVEACSKLQRGHGLFLFADRTVLDKPADIFSPIWQTGKQGEFGSLLD